MLCQITSEKRGKGFSPAVFISMFGLFKGAIQLCHCCQAFKTVYIHDKGIYLILITSLQALPDFPVTCKLIAFKQELEKKKLIGMHHYLLHYMAQEQMLIFFMECFK